MKRCGLVFVSIALYASPSFANDCTALLPDFNCEGRVGRYEGFIPAQTFEYLFEDPFITTGLTAVYVQQDYPIDSAFDGGEVQVYALQARLAITDRLAFIATKDGYARHKPGSAILDDQDGYFDVAAGLKYQLIDHPETQFAVAPAIRVEFPVGNKDVFSGHHHGLIIPSISFAKGFDKLHALGSAGAELSIDRDKGVDFAFYNLQIDYKLARYLSPFVGLNGIYYFSDGDGSLPVQTNVPALGTLPLGTVQAALGFPGFEGAEVLNLGSDDVSGNSLISGAIGTWIPLSAKSGLGFAYEVPFGRKDLNARRFHANFLFEF